MNVRIRHCLLVLISSSAIAAADVPAPWTPVKAQANASGVEVAVWGRTYRFANAPLPTSVVAAGEEILAAPIRLDAVANGKPMQWPRPAEFTAQPSSSEIVGFARNVVKKPSGNFIFSQSDTNAVVSGWQANDTLIVNTTSRIEFDGMMRVDLVVMPQQKASPKLERLWLEIPLKRSRATLFHHWPGAWGAAKNSGAVPDDGLVIPFRPFVWLGWEDGGLGWFAESDKGWQPKESAKPIEIVRDGETTVLRLHLLDLPPVRLPVTFTFGFQATPVKPMPKNFHEWRICHGASYETDTTPALEHAAKLGVKTLVFHEHWTPIQDCPVTTQETELKRLVKNCHARGIKLLLYYGYEMSTLAPEWGAMSDEVLVRGTSGGYSGGYHRAPEQRDYIVCYNSRWRDILADGIARSLGRYGYDGVYLDGTIEPWACANERHGCGYRDADGKLHATYPVFAVRDLMQRLYAMTRPRHGLVNAHQSTCCATPTLAFCDSYWDGEQFEGGQLAGDPLQKLPLPTFRAEFMGRNFGVPCEFLVYERPPNWTFDHALAFTMLHDVTVRPGSIGAPLEKMAKIWDVMSRFGASDAAWHPYWNNGEFVKTELDAVKVSFYERRSQLLLVVSNLSAQQETTAQLTLAADKLKLPARAAAKDALTGEPLTLEGHRLSVPLQPMRMRMILVE